MRRLALTALALLAFLAQLAAAAEEVPFGYCTITDGTDDDGLPVKKADCDYEKYVLEFIPMFVLAGFGIITLIFCPFFFCCRQCCNCCGGTQPSPGSLCCPPRIEESHIPINPYPDNHIKGSKACTCVVLAIGLIGLAVGVAGVSKEGEAYDSGFDGALHVPNWVESQFDGIYKCMQKREHGIYTDPAADCGGDRPTHSQCYLVDWYPGDTLDEIDQETASWTTDINDAKSDADPYKSDTVTGSTVALVVPCALLLVGLLFAALNVRRCGPMILIAFFFLLIVLLFLTLASEASLHKLSNDICPELDKMVEGNMDNLVKVVIDETCRQKQFEDNRQTIQNEMEQGCENACTEALDICDDKPAYSSATSAEAKRLFYNDVCVSGSGVAKCRAGVTFVKSLLSDKTAGLLPKQGAPANMLCPAPAGVCTIEECAKSCQDADTRDFAAKAWNRSVEAEIANSTCYAVNMVPILSCNTIFTEAAVKPQQTTCTKLTDGSGMVVAGTVLLLLALILGIFVQAHGAKAFMPLGGRKLAVKGDDGEDFMMGDPAKYALQ
eukprot:TRINITY_DN49988_c0_g1_i1.p1 TRINITY_DN49988_c0_g1~~TRINITY_DN49988_c0_g1_i1.p1  ORF type:complete len:552 (+),score=170.18 TRINITY_DN49988_c0_g1_i1:113-1768(+)